MTGENRERLEHLLGGLQRERQHLHFRNPFHILPYRVATSCPIRI